MASTKFIFVHLSAYANHVKSKEVEKVRNYNFNYYSHSLLHTDTHVLRSYTEKEEKILSVEFVSD